MPRRIETLTLRGFRGASTPLEIKFDATAPITLIFGENGSGKSTICDAIDFICNNRFGSLQDKSASMKASEAVVALGASAAQLDVQLRYGGDEWQGKLKGTKPSVLGPEQKPVAHILRRVDISRVVEAAPKDKYEALKSFIAAPGIEKSEKTLRDAVNTTKRELEEAGRAKEHADSSLQQLWELEGAPGSDPLGWAHDMLAEDSAALQARGADIQSRISAAAQARDVAQRVEAANAQQREVARRAEQANSALAEAQQQSHGRNAALLKVLREADAFLKASDPGAHCPLCGQASDRAHLQQHVAAQLAEMNALLRLQESADAAQRELATAVAGLRAAENAATPALSTALLAPEALTALNTQFKAIQNTLGQRNALRSHVQTIERYEQPIIANTLRLSKLEKMLTIVEGERKAHVDTVLSEISSTVDALYARIHPNEDLGAVRVYLKPGSVGSLELDARFGTEKICPPASYYSEAHLDTLGLCVYLALARHSGQDSIIVLDDVLTSIDDAHLGRVIDLMHEEAGNFNQVIITTHFRAWRDKYRFHQAPGNRIQLIQLHRWSLERGVRTSKDTFSNAELREWLDHEPFERQIVASKAGVLAEGLLDRLTEMYHCKLPRKADNTYSLVELARSIDSKLKRELTIRRNGQTVPLEPLINTVDSYAYVRNQVGAHYNPQGANVSDDDVRALGGAVFALAEALVCPVCGSMPTRAKAPLLFECSCGVTSLEARA